MSCVKMIASLVVGIVVCPVAARTLAYTVAGAQFQETSRDDQLDLLTLRVQGTVRSAEFNRSRGVGDVAAAVGGKLIFAGELIDLPTGRTEGRVRAPDFWLATGVTARPGNQTLLVHSAQRTCKVKLPSRASTPSVEPNTNAWFAAIGERSAVFLAEQRAAGRKGDGAANRLLPLQLDLATCRLRAGQPIASPGFDYRLQSNGRVFWLSSNVESSLAWSKDGLKWHAVRLPEPTHALLSAHFAADGVRWVAVSRSDNDFALGLYRQSGPDDQWQSVDWDDAAVPTNWLEAAREIAAQRALKQTAKTMDHASAGQRRQTSIGQEWQTENQDSF